jgi:hypothetical protein
MHPGQLLLGFRYDACRGEGRVMAASYSATVQSFLGQPSEPLVAALALADQRRFRNSEPQQVRAWEITIASLRAALGGFTEAGDWRLILEFPLRRLGRRLDAVLATPRGIFVLEFKADATGFTAADRRQVEDYALDLQDFHAGSRGVPIVPILIATRGVPGQHTWPLLLAGTAAEVIDASGVTLGPILRALWKALPEPGQTLDPNEWEHAAYHPVPGIIDAARTLYSHHGVADIAAARADATNLSTTTDAILREIADAKCYGRYVVVCITGIPGAGKTLCGLNAVFGAGKQSGAIFLTGNPTLVHVLREALARDAAQGDRSRLRVARQRTKSSIQALPAFRDQHVGDGLAPPEHVAVIDEAQRVWARAHAVRKSLDREVKLTDSEPFHLLDIMGRHPDWAVVICLIGNGQEIHDGEGGLAEWGTALAAHPKWQVRASPGTRTATEPRQSLPDLPGLRTNPDLHLNIPIRSLRNSAASDWVDAALRGDAAAARDIAERRGTIPFSLTRSLADMRAHLRHCSRGLRRCGLLASSGAKRLRADGLGSELAHMDAGAVARWFLDHWPEDVRASDALEQVATEFSCQGLELDNVGLCWGGDFIHPQTWRVREFVGTRWNVSRAPEAIANRINTYRVLLTRARYETVIWVPMGDAVDATRDIGEMDAVAAFLRACGIGELAEPNWVKSNAPIPEPTLL